MFRHLDAARDAMEGPFLEDLPWPPSPAAVASKAGRAWARLQQRAAQSTGLRNAQASSGAVTCDYGDYSL